MGRLAGGVAHDFNNLLTVIGGYSHLMAGQLRPGDPLLAYAEAIRAAADRAATLTRQLLAFSRKQIIEPKVMDLNGTIRESAPMLQRLIGEDIELRTHLANDLEKVLADPHQMYQVLMNLVVNSRDAMPDGGSVVIATANVELDEAPAQESSDATPGRFVQMMVTDNGVGMDAEVLQHLFEPFYTTKDSGKGTGLGLSMVYGIVRQNGGWIEVRSELGAGTSFRVHLPIVAETGVPEAGPAKPGAAPRGRETILVVEDQEEVRIFAKVSLELSGYLVIAAANAEEALRAAAAHPGPIHLALLDVVLPGMNGKEASEILRQTRRGLRVLFMSGYTADIISRRGVLEKGVAFVHKPFSPAELAGKVREVLDGSGAP